MIGIELDRDCSEVRKSLLFDHHIFTGNSNDKTVLRILPALNIKKRIFYQCFENSIGKH
jgi:acetylornithine aminotransferase